MRATATAFRKSLFPMLERALRGEPVEILYKGATVKLTPDAATSKLARAKRQHALLCDPDSIVSSDDGLLAEIDKDLDNDWRDL